MSKTPSYNQAIRAYTLQRVHNYEIDTFGRASTGTTNRLMDLCDALNEDAQDIFIRLCMDNMPIDDYDDYDYTQL